MKAAREPALIRAHSCLLTFFKCLFTHLVKVFFCMASRSSASTQKERGYQKGWLAGSIDSLRQWPLRYDTMQVVSGRRITSNDPHRGADLAIGDDDPTVIANYRCNRVTIIAASFRCAGVANGACHRARLSSSDRDSDSRVDRISRLVAPIAISTTVARRRLMTAVA